MNLIILDADGLIKLSKIGLVPLLAKSYSCIITKEVFKETVEKGKKHFYEDAFILEDYVNRGIVKVVAAKPVFKAKKLLQEVHSLGEGEKSTLCLFYTQNALAIVSDDVAFLNLLNRHNIPYLTPANLILRLVELKKISKQEGLTALKKLRPYIRSSIYKLVKKELEVKRNE